jgi:phosphoribosylformimino-5-aminoimidazole carboxamide ribotide isomerase
MLHSRKSTLIIPAVDIKNGKCVQLVQGKPGTEQVIIDDPINVALEWERRGASLLHLIDLDGALKNSDRNIRIIENMIKKISIPIQLGGGIRNKENASKLLSMGVNKIILGTLAIENPEDVRDLSQEFGSVRIMVALDSKDSKVVIKGWTENTGRNAPELAKIFEDGGAGSILFTNVDFEGLMKSFDIIPALKVVEAVDIPVIYSGGISSLQDIKKLAEIGVVGVVIGSAFYKGKIKFEDALTYEDR